MNNTICEYLIQYGMDWTPLIILVAVYFIFRGMDKERE